MKIIVDADASPVKSEVIEVANEFGLGVLLVMSYAHFSAEQYPSFVETVYVDSESEAADYKVMQLANAGDLIITQDYGLASLVLSKGCSAMHHKGFLYTHENIDRLLTSRYLNQQARKSGQRFKGPKPFTGEEREIFREKLVRIVKEAVE
ncbi:MULTISPECIES: YaiI/YqxD family protein [Allobacillus]|uniref:UPF0178 protein FPQ13_08555 n=1 Tax=Allobacillus salarius TaxID=1955272 RepID=A0A556PKS8_9BACI|nr:YaiI/YqxD family protein [Allobacillus salarius]TSJ64988.1 YaiI/YqxD family protein [Allobacillus salarius]